MTTAGLRAEPRLRVRATFVFLAAATILLGLLVHRTGLIPGAEARDVIGDALWATMMTWWVGAVAPGARLAARGATAFGISVAVELSQLVHAAWIDAIRQTTLGQLVLGSGFNARDLAAYAVGVLAAVLLERLLVSAGSSG